MPKRQEHFHDGFGMMRFGVVGDPVKHSLSPAIHNAGFRHLGIDAEYVHIEAAVEVFGSVIEELRTGELTGVSVTMPHKATAYAAVDSRSALAEQSSAVNTIIRSDGRLEGFNTDVAGVSHAISLLDLPADVPVLILGTGGAARAAVVALGEHPVAISGRNSVEASEVLTRTHVSGVVQPWGEPLEGAAVVNATPLGMYEEQLPTGIVEAAGGLVDMTYGAARTPAIMLAHNNGIPAADGIDMLVGQAAEAFELFCGEQPPMDVMEAAARRS
jgi:shikimate dehydrogenase